MHHTDTEDRDDHDQTVIDCQFCVARAEEFTLIAIASVE